MPFAHADLNMASAVEKRLEKLDAEIAELQPEIKAAREKYGIARKEDEKKFKEILDQLVEKEKALISSRDKLQAQLTGAQPGGVPWGVDQMRTVAN